ncbi:MAG TPA: glycogen debranching protein GlgX [Solirubrobacteraceae bacterium]|nr:glycogen debranching protein GlgX [Solirubrobacteraceae bacterium]
MPAGGSSSPHPLGVTVVDDGVNVAVYSRVASGVDFSTFDGSGAETRHALTLADSDIWHGFVPGVEAGQEYGFRVSGPYAPTSGVRCNPSKLLLDPRGRSVTGNLTWEPSWNGAAAGAPNTPDLSDSAPQAPRSVVVQSSFDWAGDAPLGHALADSVIYELHVKGFTATHPDVPGADQGTYAGLANPAVIAYLQGLGVTAVELLPVHQSLTNGVLSGGGLTNYWGYDTIGFFAVHGAYSAARRAGGAPGSEVDEFKAMVKALHAAGIEVILDVVFNHTAEGSELGPTLSFRGIDNAAYYELVPGQPQSYDNLTGCGNTIAAASPPLRRLILDSLRYWVGEMHVDGFRFDLGAVLGSDQPGTTGNADPGWDPNAAFFDLVLQDPTLAGSKLIAEPWTGAGDEQGQFPPRWSEWNGQYRDTIRDFWRDQSPSPRWVGARLAGSPDMYASNAPRFGMRRQPTASINFITCHDGFTLNDLVSYDAKRNSANQQNNTDGTDDNRSWNCGSGPGDDGPTANPDLAAERRRQQRNLLATLLVSRGVPMILAGDERGRTQQGNNNAYCQDNEISWLDWTDDPSAENLTTVVRSLIKLRSGAAALRAARFPDPGGAEPSAPVPDTGLGWFDPDGSPVAGSDWDNPAGHSFAAVFPALAPGPAVLVMVNAYWEPLVFTVPSPPSGAWTASLDTTQEDGTPTAAGPLGEGATITVGPRSVVIAST